MPISHSAGVRFTSLAAACRWRTNADSTSFWRLFGGCTTTYGDLCWPAGLEATRLTLGDNRHSVPWDIARARLILMWGKNAAETNIHQMAFIDQALALGMMVAAGSGLATSTSSLPDSRLAAHAASKSLCHSTRPGWTDEQVHMTPPPDPIEATTGQGVGT